MTDWLLKTIIISDHRTTFGKVADFIRQKLAIAQEVDKMPVVEVELDGTWYVVCRKTDWIERFGE